MIRVRPGTDGMDGCDRHRKSVIPSPRPVRRVYSLIVSYVVIAKIFLAKCAKDSYDASYKKLNLLYLGQTPAAADVCSLTTKPESQNISTGDFSERLSTFIRFGPDKRSSEGRQVITGFVFVAHHDDRHRSRAVAVLRRRVKVRLQFTCHLHLHVVLHHRVVLRNKQAECADLKLD